MRFVEEEDYYLDTKTGLKWSNENFGPMTWHEAMKLPKSWWLPTLKELLSIVDDEKYNPASELPGMLSAFYWSSASYADSCDYAWGVHFYNGFDCDDDKSSTYYIRYIKED